MVNKTAIEIHASIEKAALDASAEASRAVCNHGMFNSVHEAYGVLVEEVDEFFDEVKKKARHRSRHQMRAELIQVAAVAIKAAATLLDGND